jgi:hypothetical protein
LALYCPENSRPFYPSTKTLAHPQILMPFTIFHSFYSFLTIIHPQHSPHTIYITSTFRQGRSPFKKLEAVKNDVPGADDQRRFGGKSAQKLKPRTRLRKRTQLLIGKSLCKTVRLRRIPKTLRKRRILIRNDHRDPALKWSMDKQRNEQTWQSKEEQFHQYTKKRTNQKMDDSFYFKRLSSKIFPFQSCEITPRSSGSLSLNGR